MKKYLFIIALLCSILLFSACGKKNTSEETDSVASDETTVDSVTTVSFSDGTTTLRFSKDETGNWAWLDDATFPVDSSILLSVIEMAQEDMLTDSLPSSDSLSSDDLTSYGLHTQNIYLKLGYADDSTDTLYFGNITDEGVYILVPGDQISIHLVPLDLRSMLSTSIYDMMLLPDLPSMTADNITSVTIASSEQTILLDCEDGNWLLSGNNVTDSVTDFANMLASIKMDRCADYAPSDGVTAVCGLLTPLATVTVSYINTVDVASEFVLTIGSEHDDSYYYATINDDTTVYYFSKTQASPIFSLLNNGIN